MQPKKKESPFLLMKLWGGGKLDDKDTFRGCGGRPKGGARGRALCVALAVGCLTTRLPGEGSYDSPHRSDCSFGQLFRPLVLQAIQLTATRPLMSLGVDKACAKNQTTDTSCFPPKTNVPKRW